MMKQFLTSVRHYASPNRIKPFQVPIVHKPVRGHIDSLRERGFLRSQKPYDPPKDAVQQINAIISELGGVKNFQSQKFEFLVRCSNTFKHCVPNSQLHEMKSIDNVYDFYQTPVDCQTPYEKLVKENDVPNLHLIPNARRFNPEEDGVSAFPKSSTLVTGLKYRKKYKSHFAKTSWP